MANTRSARKRAQTHARNRDRNRTVRAQLRTEVKRFRSAVASGDAEVASALLRRAHSIIDRTAKLGVIHSGTASRYKSRLSRARDRMASGSSS